MDNIALVLALIPIGIVAGYLNVMAGGGSLLTVPALMLLGLPGHVANGTNRIAIVAQNITAVTTFYKRGFHNFKLGFTLAACAIPGGLIGAWMGVQLQGVWFNRFLATVMIIIAVVMAFDSGSKESAKSTELSTQPENILLGHILMFFAGIYGGIIQIGVGFILMAILYRIMKIDLVRVNMFKVFIVLCYSIAALSVFASQLQLAWQAGLALAIGNSIGGYLGVHYSITKGEKWIKVILNIVLAAVILRLLLMSGG